MKYISVNAGNFPDSTLKKAGYKPVRDITSQKEWTKLLKTKYNPKGTAYAYLQPGRGKGVLWTRKNR